MQSVPSPWIRFTFNFYLFNQICHLDFSQLENQIERDNTFYMVQFMDQSLEQQNSNKKTGNVHMKTHIGEKLNKCNQCDFASSQAGNLRRHLKRHSGKKSNKCNQCDYASPYASALRTHLKTHSGEKSNKCNLCDYASSQTSNLRTHLKTRSGEKSNKGNQCNFASSWAGHLRGPI